MVIKLYIGAHKTATTHVQELLWSSREYLDNKNIKVSTPNNLRQRWLPCFFAYADRGEVSIIGELKAAMPMSDIWILAEENISGSSYGFLTDPGMYPKLKHRLLAIKNLYNNCSIEIYFSIRSYETFYRSTYLEVVRNRGYIPFSEYYDENRFKNNSWCTLISSMLEVIPEKNLTLWCYEDFEGLMPDILQSMTGNEYAKHLINNYTTVLTRPSLSNKVINVLSSKYPEVRGAESVAMINELSRQYPLSDKHPPFIAFDEYKSEEFQNKYFDDKEKIKNIFPDINFLNL